MAANVIRVAKSGNDWTKNELGAYNIRITLQNATTFFDTPALPEPAIHQEILTTLSADDTVVENNYALLTQMDLAMPPVGAEASAVDDFVVALFRALGYTNRPRAIRTQKDIRLLICGEYKYARSDVVIIDRSQDAIILLVQVDKHLPTANHLDPFTRLIAGAIAAFQSNNARRFSSGLDPLESKVFPGIVMIGTSPAFFKIPITIGLVECVQRGEYPAVPTFVLCHMPEIPRPTRRESEGMKPLDNRRIIFQCFEAFKQFV